MEYSYDLFGEPIQEKKQYSVKITKQSNKLLTKNQQAFNRITKRIENLNLEIENYKQKLELLLETYNNKVIPLEKPYAQSKIELAKTLAETSEKYKLNKNQIQQLQVLIQNLCREAFSFSEPDMDAITFYNTWNEKSYEDEIAEQKAAFEALLEVKFKNKFGIDIDLSELDGSADSYSKIQEKIKEEQEKQSAKDKSTPEKKTKKQLEKEAQQKNEAETLAKSIRSIYLSLAKMLHPDTVSDENEKLIKEELMKKVTGAYQEKDLPTLLKLEMQFVSAESNNIEKLSDDKLKIYISALKEQVAELEEEKMMQYQNPRYSKISYCSYYPEKKALAALLSKSSFFKEDMEYNERMIGLFQYFSNKKTFLNFITQEMERSLDVEIWDDLFD
ncbi:MAG: hypothetical protein H0X62_03355 [Bacteroidetes bacterium]|nr:hypothetical protein [Bacteroidota bacterium]